MEHSLNPQSNHQPGSIDKSKVMDVRPLRCLIPLFPNPPGMPNVPTPHAAPFACVPPGGPFPQGVQPFYPFLAPNDPQHTGYGSQNQQGNFGHGGTIPAPVPLNTFRTPVAKPHGRRGRPRKNFNPSKPVVLEGDGYGDSQNDQYVNEFGLHTTDAEASNKSVRRRGRPRKRKPGDGDEIDVESIVNSFLALFKLNGFDDFRRASGDRDTVGTILLVFSLLRRRLTQLVEANDLDNGIARLPELKAGTLLMTKEIRTNVRKRIGHVPGIEVGDIFFVRMELCIVGLHAPSMAGIDYMSVKITTDEEPVAVSIVSSGGYDDEGDGGDMLIYTGQGGVQRRYGQMNDQKLERGNLALEKSLHRANDVRVIRGIKDALSTGKIYVYDGLYRIQESWAEKKSGCNVFKYKLIRVPGQPQAYTLWKSIQRWRDGTATQTGVILPDLTLGSESQPVTLVNDVDGEKGPGHFFYILSLRHSKPFPASKPSSGCHCMGGCQPGDTHCPCNQKNDGLLPYSSIGVLLTSKPLIYECGQTCACPPNCRNRTSQAGIKIHLEVFKTKNRGWGLRSWDPIRAGAFICEYAGDVINDAGGSFGNESDNNYIFDATRYYKPLEAVHDDSTGSKKVPFPLVISAKNKGNVARFMNHSCLPNVFWQPVLRENNNESYLHIAFFAIGHIPPMQELAYDYGTVPPEKGEKGKKKCLCGSVKCRGYFY